MLEENRKCECTWCSVSMEYADRDQNIVSHDDQFSVCRVEQISPSVERRVVFRGMFVVDAAQNESVRRA